MTTKRKAREELEGTPTKRSCLDGIDIQQRKSNVRTNDVKQNKEMFDDEYIELDVIGEGSYGAVYSAIRLDDAERVAIKHIPKDKVKYMLVENGDFCYWEISEVVLMALAAGYRAAEDNPAVIGLLDVFVLETEVLIVMERQLHAMDLIDFYDLREGQILEHEAKSIIKQLVDASALMIKNKVFHRDLKEENVLVSMEGGTPSIKVIDFGCSALVQDKPCGSFAGTVDCAPPEIFLGKQCLAEPTTVWQIGLILWNFFNKERFNILKFIKGPIPSLDNLSTVGEDFLKKCLKINPTQRSGLTELQNHPWLE